MRKVSERAAAGNTADIVKESKYFIFLNTWQYLIMKKVYEVPVYSTQ